MPCKLSLHLISKSVFKKKKQKNPPPVKKKIKEDKKVVPEVQEVLNILPAKLTVAEQIELSTQKIHFTIHSIDRLQERLKVPIKNVQIDIITAIIAGSIRHCIKLKSYKVFGEMGIYVLSEELEVITIITDKYENKSDQHYLTLDKHHMKYLTRKLGFIL